MLLVLCLADHMYLVPPDDRVRLSKSSWLEQVPENLATRDFGSVAGSACVFSP